MNRPIGRLSQEIQVIYAGKLIHDLALFQTQFRNSGNHLILSDDFIEPIEIQITGIDEIASSEIVSATPSGISPIIKLHKTGITLEKLLLNPDDQFIIEIMAIPTLGAKPSVQPPTARIPGIKKIEFQPRLKAASSPKGLIPEAWSSTLISIVGAVIAALAYEGVQALAQWRKRKATTI